MNETAKVTGGDLLDLWKIANINLPNVQAVYGDAANVIHGIDDSSDEIAERFGRCQPAWADLAQIYEQALFVTYGSLLAVSYSIKSAIDEFSEADEAAAKDLASKLDDPEWIDPDEKLTDDEKPADVEVPRWWD